MALRSSLFSRKIYNCYYERNLGTINLFLGGIVMNMKKSIISVAFGLLNTALGAAGMYLYAKHADKKKAAEIEENNSNEENTEIEVEAKEN